MFLPMVASKAFHESPEALWRSTLSRIALGESKTGGLPGLRFERRLDGTTELGSRLETFWTGSESGSRPVETRVTLWEPDRRRFEITVFSPDGEKARSYRYSITAQENGGSRRHLFLNLHFPLRARSLLRLLLVLPFLGSIARDAA